MKIDMNKPLPTIVFMVVITTILTTVLTGAHLLTRRQIELKRKFEFNKNLLLAAGLIDESQAQKITPGEVDQLVAAHIEVEPHTLANGNEFPIYRCYSDTQKQHLVAYAFRVEGAGFWDRIMGVIAFEPDKHTVRGLRFIDQLETPGLGARITEPWFYRQFEGKRLVGDSGEPILRLTPPTGKPKPEGELDAISGASETSRAVVRFMNEDIKTFVDLVKQDSNTG